MSSLIGLSIDVTKIDKTKLVNGKYLNLTVSVNDDTNQYGQNASVFNSQTKEEREAQTPKNYLGNGKVFWNDGKIVNAVKQEATTEVNNVAEVEDDLPF